MILFIGIIKFVTFTAIEKFLGRSSLSAQYINFNRHIRFIWFGDDSYPIQFIGSEAASSNTWLWSWDNLSIIALFKNELKIEFEDVGEFLRIKSMNALPRPQPCTKPAGE
jgi:hypothetical protein